MIKPSFSIKQYIKCILPLCLCVSLLGCASLKLHDRRGGRSVALTLCQKGEVLLQRSTLYFGAARPDGGVVDDARWAQFLADVVTPEFPDGMTWFDAQGQWRGSSDIVHEHARLVVLLHASDVATQRRVNSIAEQYKRRFAQESVLQERVAACARFH